jgi:hypothetical protein
LKERSPRTSRQASKATSEEPAAESDTTEQALKPGDDKAVSADGQPSRRGAAAAIKEKDAEIERLVSEKLAEKQRADEHAGKLSALTAAQEAARKAALDKIGSDADFERLQNLRIRREPMSYEDDEKLDEMLAWREHASTLWDLTDKAHRTGIAQALGNRVERYGLDKDTAFGADLPGLVDHVAERTELRVRKETADELASLKKQHAEDLAERDTTIKGLRARAGATPAPTVGGASAPSGDLPADGASPTSFFAVGIRNRPHQQRGGGGSAARRAS